MATPIVLYRLALYRPKKTERFLAKILQRA